MFSFYVDLPDIAELQVLAISTSYAALAIVSHPRCANIRASGHTKKCLWKTRKSEKIVSRRGDDSEDCESAIFLFQCLRVFWLSSAH